jgi:chemosensory pili system protein ChpA (sensor histidine kinase/response regulator)
VAIDIPLELDSGPITWVKAEIDGALFRVLAAINTLRTAPTAELRAAIRADLHQVSGAFELVGIEGLAVLVQEFEKHFAADASVVPLEALDLVDRGCRRLLAHLKEMVSGSPPVPLKFISEYLALGKLRRSKFGPADLFFPDLSRRPAKIVSADPPDPSRMPAFLLRQRRDFQQGLLLWLRGNEAGLDQMRSAIAAIETAYPLPSQRSFWWATHALLEATHAGLLESSTALKQLMARVDLQVRRFVEGSTRVADRLRREVLYHVARAQVGNARVDAVKTLYDLGVLVPKRISREIDVVSLQPAIDSLVNTVRLCKDAWTSLSAGRKNALARLHEAVTPLPAACDALGMPDFSNLGRSIAGAAETVSDVKSIGDDLSIEFATSLILLETALEHIAALPASFHSQVDRAVQRLTYASTNAPIPTELRSESEANSLTRLAQEKQTISQVAREIRTNMRLVEQALDAVFRDRTAIDELKAVPALLGQVSGAMRMLGWDGANDLLTSTSDRLINLVRREDAIGAAEIDSLADVLAGLSFYVDVRERREQDADAILVGLARRLHGEIDLEAADSDHSVEASIADRQRMLRPLAVALVNEPQRSDLRDTLRSTLQGVRQDAELLSDAGLSDATTEALRVLDSGESSTAALSNAIAVVVDGDVGVPPTSKETSRLVVSQQAEQDTALLEIFVEEAVEVVATVRQRHTELVLHHDRREPLIDVRRAFHTLKGSGRMVGQVQLAEVAWRVEGALNRALEADRPASDHELHLIDVATETFSGWIEALRTHQAFVLDVDSLDPLIEQCTPRQRAASATPAAVTEPTASAPALELAQPADDGTSLANVESIELDALIARAVDSLEQHELLSPAVPMSNLATPPTLESIELVELAFPDDDAFAHVGAANDGDDIQVLGVWVSRALFSILTDETRVHLQTLDYELTLMQFDPELLPSDAMVRASHTLCGIHRTARFQEIGDFAGRLESALMAVRRSGRTSLAISVFAAAIQALRTATLRLQAQSPMTVEERSHIDYSRKQLLAMITQAGNADLDAEVELLEMGQTDSAPAAVVPAVLVAPLSEQKPVPPPIAAHTPSSAIAPVAVVAAATTAAAVAMKLPDRIPFAHPPSTVDVELPPAPTASAPSVFDSLLPSVDIMPIAEHAADPLPMVASAAVAAPVDLIELRPIAPPAAVVSPPASAPINAVEHAERVEDSAPAAAPMESIASVISPASLAPASDVIAVAVEPTPVAAPLFVPPAAPVVVSVSAPAAPIARFTALPLTAAGGAESRAKPVERSIGPLTRATEDPLADVRDDIDEQVLPIFLEEAQELFPRASEEVSAWRRDAGNPIHSDGLKRTLHTLKGSARMAGAMRLGEVAHNLETRLLDVGDEPAQPVFDSFDEYLDDIAFLLERLTRGEKDAVLPRFVVAAAVTPEVIDDILPDSVVAGDDAALVSVAPVETAAADVAPLRSLTEIARSLAVRSVGATTATAAPLLAEPAGTAFLRVRSDAVEQLADEAGEISIHRSRIEAEMRSLKIGLLDLTASVVRLRGQLREIEIQGESQIQSRLDQESEFDPLEFDRYTRFQELTRGLAEGVNDVATVQQSLLKNLADADIALLTQTRLSRSVQLRLQTLRTVPFSNVSDRLYRVLRQTAKELGKRANLDIRGGRIEIDRSVLERLAPVLEHLVRNALAHGIEAEFARLALGKPGIGEITLNARQQGNEVVISLDDDGGGIPLDKVRARGIALGLISANDSPSDGQLVEFIFQPGFSTADQITAVAGRGVGMDVVRSEVAALGGRVEVQTSKGASTSFILSVPLTLAVTQVLLVGVGKAVFGVPSSLIAQVRQLPANERADAMAAGRLIHEGVLIPFRALGDLMDVPQSAGTASTAPILVVRAGDLVAAVQVERVINNQEVVAKPYGPQLARVPGLAGLTVLANGTIALLINPLNLILSQDVDSSQLALRESVLLPPERISPTSPVASESMVPASIEAVVHAPPAEFVPVVAAPSPASTFVEPVAAFELQFEPPAPVSAPAPAPVAAPTPIEPPAVATVVIAPVVVASVAVAPVAIAPVVVAPRIEAPAPAPAPVVAPPVPAPLLVPQTATVTPIRGRVVVESRVPVVLVVDDSLTVRKITTRLLEREGYKALTAKDGLDALQILADINPDVILLDIEMPRMDGFEFTRTIKADNRQSHIPIIMITSRTAEKHRNHAMELGVNEYVGKPYQDEHLMALVVKYAGKPT